jgi:DNA repair photolyase
MFLFCSNLSGMTFDFQRRKYSLRGRGSASNPANRFDSQRVEAFDDGWHAPVEDKPVLKTEISEESPRSFITYNRSPDLPFDRSINPYRGCEHGCIYCFARPSHAFLGLSAGLDFETRLIARKGAAVLLEKELCHPKYKVETIALGTNTDPYQPIEKKYEITRSCLKVFKKLKHPVAIVTRGSLVERDIDILSDLARDDLTRVGISVTTLNADLARKLEPRAPSPKRRLLMIKRLSEAGIPVRVMASPLIPGLSDHEMEAILAAGKDAGAESASWIMLRLPREVSDLFQDWLDRHAPDRKNRVLGHLRDMHNGALYSSEWFKRMRGQGALADMMERRFQLSIKRLGLVQKVKKLRTDLFCPPAPKGRQLEFF